MTMSIVFTFVLYGVSASHLERRLPPSSQYGGLNDIFTERDNLRTRINDFFQRRIDEEKVELAWQLFGINMLMLIGGAAVSYVLARKSLEPIEKVMASKDQFISDASHELRTPLTALQTANEVALRKSKLSTQQARSLIEENLVEAKRLQQLTDGLLGLMKENPNVTQETVQLQEIVLEAFGHIIAKAQEKNITVNDNVPPIKLKTDGAMLTQTISILLDNAIKYSHKNTAISVEAKQTKKRTLISVTDQGIGIKSGDIDHIFDRFYRADQSRNKQVAEGYGLGLAIAKKIADSIGADISVKSSPGKGSTFTLSIP